MTATGPRRVAVIGGGITGISAALFLQRDGHDVTVFERDEFGTGTSMGNSGVVSIAGCIPTSVPGIVGRVPKMLMDPYGPLSIRWGYLPKLLPWLIGFARNSREDRVRANARAKSALLEISHAAYDTLIEQADAESLISRRGVLKVFGSDASFAGAQFEMDVMRECGRKFTVLGADEIRQMEPALQPIFEHGIFYDDNSALRHPGRLVQRFAKCFVAGGGTVVKSSVTGFHGETVVRTDGGDHETDIIVIAAGSWSANLVRQFGSRIMLDTERGYHIMLPHPDRTLNRPVALADHSVFLSPMEHGLRLTTGVELGGNEAPPDFTRARRMVGHVSHAVKGFRTEEQSNWLGFRPSTPSGVPYLGALPKHPNVYLAAGGGHVGMTMGPVSGRIVADLVAGRDPGVDLTPYRID
ncbi:MAG: FAD-binding oxidoreductase [Alphaproteobacteria bacterium]